MKKLITKHQPQITMKSYCTEVNSCKCGLIIKAEDDKSWQEWAKHLEELYELSKLRR